MSFYAENYIIHRALKTIPRITLSNWNGGDLLESASNEVYFKGTKNKIGWSYPNKTFAGAVYGMMKLNFWNYSMF